MDVLRLRSPRWITAGLGVLLAALVTTAAPSAAANSSFDVGDQAVVIVQARGSGNDVVVRTWDRNTVQVESSDEGPQVERRADVFGAGPPIASVPPLPYLSRDVAGQVNGGGVMPPEDFPYAGLRPGPHDTVRFISQSGSHVVVTVPASTGVLQLRVGGGTTAVDGYRGHNLFVVQNTGRVQLNNSVTTTFAQLGTGVLYAAGDTFERIRVRALAAQVVFERCRSKQIETSTISGTIVYDGGTFDPGLARFESQTGDVALGVASPAQLSGRTQDGHVFTSFARNGASVAARGDGDATATVGGGGGALVNAISERGNVFFYDGTLAARRLSPVEWRAVHRAFAAARRARIFQPPNSPRRPALVRFRALRRTRF